jgi:23S rRNA (adenine2503-C2)-methyltransferase
MMSIHDDLEPLRAWLRIDPEHLRRLRNALYKKHASVDIALEQLPEAQRNRFRAEVEFHTLELHSRHDSQLDGATKIVFRTPGGQLIESVILRIATGRTSLCVSSQVGCAMRCKFCATGQMEGVRDLSYPEILDQLLQANRLLAPEGRSIRNVVFMGMGEPFHNEDNVCRTLDTILASTHFDLSPRHVVVSTVGIPAAMVRCAQRYPRLGMALSLHSARQSVREQIIPLARRYPLDGLRSAMLEILNLQKRPLMIEYLLLDGLNDGDDDRQALIEYLQGLPVHINLIPYNAIAGTDLRGTPPERQHYFAEALKVAGFAVTVRYSLGTDVAAACGQLVRSENRRRALTVRPAYPE